MSAFAIGSSLRVICAVSVLALGACTSQPVFEPRIPNDYADGESRSRSKESKTDTLINLGDASAAGGDFGGAANMYRQAVSLNPEDPRGYVRLGDALLRLGALDEAADAFRDGLAVEPASREGNRGYGRVMLALNRPEIAVPYFDAALAIDSEDTVAINGIGVAHDLAGRHAQAQQSYERGLMIDPASRSLRNNLGLSLALTGSYQDSVDLLEQVSGSPGATARNRQNLALAYGLKGDRPSAERISRIDLEDEAVAANLSYFSALKGMTPGRTRSASLAPDRPEPPASQTPKTAQIISRVANPPSEPADSGVEPAVTVAGRWFIDLGRFETAEKAGAAWRDIRNQHGDLVGSMQRLAGASGAAQPLIIGPMASAEDARSLCDRLTTTTSESGCSPVKL